MRWYQSPATGFARAVPPVEEGALFSSQAEEGNAMGLASGRTQPHHGLADRISNDSPPEIGTPLDQSPPSH